MFSLFFSTRDLILIGCTLLVLIATIVFWQPIIKTIASLFVETPVPVEPAPVAPAPEEIDREAIMEALRQPAPTSSVSEVEREEIIEALNAPAPEATGLSDEEREQINAALME